MDDQQQAVNDLPVSVHIASASASLRLGAALPARPRQRAVTLRTIQLTQASQAWPVLSRDLARAGAWVQALTQDVTLARSRAEAETGEGYTLPHANTAPTPLDTTDEVWAYAAAVPAQLSVLTITEAGT